MFYPLLFAWHRSERTQNHTVEWLFDHVKYLGHLLDFDLEFYDEYVKFQDVLDAIDPDNVTKVYDSQNVFEFKVMHWLCTRNCGHCEHIFAFFSFYLDLSSLRGYNVELSVGRLGGGMHENIQLSKDARRVLLSIQLRAII